ncbi:MAG: hypothetical protein D6736_17890 [Nitrospinota bacterium]|nr:MAG: hypothetical protein D6736_17890 [Nitrospinota bacterium]
MTPRRTPPLRPTVELVEYECSREPLPLLPQEVTWLQESLGSKLSLLPSPSPGSFYLQAGPYVGSLLLPGGLVVIKPKMPLRNLFYLLSAVSTIPFQPEQSFYEQSEDWFELLVHLFLVETQRIVQGGIQTGYVPQEEAIPLIREKLLFAEMQRQPALHHRPYCRFTEHTADIVENRALKWTLFLLQHRSRFSLPLRRTIHHLLASFPPVSLVEVAPDTIEEITYTALNDRYRMALNLASLILRHLTLTLRPGSEPFYAFLINMPWLFETFVTQRLMARLHGGGCTVTRQQQAFLDKDQKVPIRVDLLLQGKRRCLVVDTKYKRLTTPGEQTGDFYQVLGYCLALGCREGVLIYPQGERGGQEGVLEVRGRRLHVLALDLRCPVEQMERAIERIARHLMALLEGKT